MLWACKHAEIQNNACNYVLCNECRKKAEVKQGKSRRRKVLATGAACDHDVWSLDIKEDNSYYTKNWRGKHMASQKSIKRFIVLFTSEMQWL